MNKGKILSVLDIGSSKITTLIAQQNFDLTTSASSINIIGVSSTPSRGVKKGQIVDIEEATEATIASVEAAERMAGYSLDRAFISVGGAHIESQNSSGVVAVSSSDSEISSDDVARVIDAAKAISIPTSREIIHVLPRDYTVDGESGVKDPVGMSGVRLEVDTHIVTASAPALKNLTKTVSEVGTNIEGIVFSGLAASYSTLTRTEKELGCVLVDIGAGTTSIAAFTDGSLSYSGAIPIGAKNVTNDLAIGLRVSLEEAERIKISLSSSKDDKKSDKIEISEEDTKETKKVYKRTLTEGIIRPRLNEIFTMVKLELERVNLINKIPSGAIVTGGGALTFGVNDAARRTLGLPVRIAKPGGVGGLIDDILMPPYAVAIGLILYAAEFEGDTHASKVKLPSVSLFSKAVNSVKNLLP